MIEVGKGEEHNDKRPDGSSKRRYQYPILAYYQLDQPLPRCVKTPMKGFETIVRSPNASLTKIWSIRDKHL